MGIRVQPRDIEIPADEPFRHDLLNRREAVDTLTHLVGNLEGPCVVAVDAAWGFGKTTFLKMWSQHLRNHGFPVVAFNAWETDFSENPFLTLSSELTEGLQSGNAKLPARTIEKLKDVSQEILRLLLPGAIRFLGSQIPMIGAQLADEAVAIAKQKMSGHAEARTSIRKFRQVLEGTAAVLSEVNGNRPLMLMVDELDRCRPSYAVELLEVAKHLFSVDRIVFVLAVNCDQLAHSVKALYGHDFDAERYLHRFFDVDFRLPEPNRQAFIRALLQATGIHDYFDQVPRPEPAFHGTYFAREAARKATGETLRDMLLLFFGASELSLRAVGQAIHRLGLLYASLRRDQADHGLATAAALILRTMDPVLYGEFVAGKVSDRDVVDTLFDRPGLKTVRYDKRTATFEAAIILAGAEDAVHGLSPVDTLSSPLLDRYRTWDPSGRESLQDADAKNPADTVRANHAIQVAGTVDHAVQHGQGLIGFSDAVRRLELFSTALIDSRPDVSAGNA